MCSGVKWDFTDMRFRTEAQLAKLTDAGADFTTTDNKRGNVKVWNKQRSYMWTFSRGLCADIWDSVWDAAVGAASPTMW